MREGLAFLTFTDRGAALAERLCGELGGTAGRAGAETSLSAWTEENFPAREALVFVGAAGIAVRAIAPHVRNKAEDPAVLCVSEDGRYVIPLLSGHLGGANALARRIAALTGGEAVITTATDLNGTFAVDLWAKKQGLCVLDPGRIKTVSARLLQGGTVTLSCPFPIRGEAPKGIVSGADGEVVVSFRRTEGDALRLVPRVLALGIGCRRGTSAEALEAAFADFCAARGVLPQAIRSAASIELKRDEPGLAAFCAAHAWPLRFYDAEQLRRAEGSFTGSAFVEETTGVDNICERAAVLCGGGKLAEKKYAAGGVTFAVAEYPTEYDWST